MKGPSVKKYCIIFLDILSKRSSRLIHFVKYVHCSVYYGIKYT